MSYPHNTNPLLNLRSIGLELILPVPQVAWHDLR